MRVSLLSLVLAVGLLSVAAAQVPPFDGVVMTHAGPLCFFDSSSGKVVSLVPQPVTQAARGGCFGKDGRIYMSAWTTNGIDVYDPTLGQWISGLQVKDPTNRTMGAPYTPAVNHENVGGFGLLCVDGNSPPASTLWPSTSRNTFFVDYSGTTPTFGIDGVFPSANVPMSDFYPNLFATKAGEEFVGVGFYTIDQKIDIYPLASSRPSTITLVTAQNMPRPSRYDATWCEDGNLWVLTDNALMRCDIRAGGKTTVVAVKGLPGSGYGAIWCDAWEKPGMKAWICSDVDDNIYSVDLLSNPPLVVTKVVKLGPAANYNVNTARHAEEAQLLSWIDQSKKSRILHVEFNPNYGGNSNIFAILVPSLSGISKGFPLGGLEIYLQLDSLSFLGLAGVLYPNFVNLGTNGQKDFQVPFLGANNTPIGIRVYWQCVLLNTKPIQFLDATNIINTEM